MNDIALPKTYLRSQLHCASCNKLALDPKDLANFVIVFWDKYNGEGDPIIQDGIFDENGRIAILKTCESCGPKIKEIHAKYPTSFARMVGFPEGPLKKMLAEIKPRLRKHWHFEIGFQFMIPQLAKLKSKQMSRMRSQ